MSSAERATVRANIAEGKKERKSEIIGGDGWTVLFRQSFFMAEEEERKKGFGNGKRCLEFLRFLFSTPKRRRHRS